MTPERLAEIRVRAEAATQGPWFGSAGGLYIYGATPGDEVARTNRPADARFIQHARSDVPDLVAEVASLWAQRDGTGDVASGTLWRAEREVSRLNNELGAQLTLRREAAQQVEKVRALHQPWDDGPQPYCTHDREPWPCPTEQALGAR